MKMLNVFGKLDDNSVINGLSSYEQKESFRWRHPLWNTSHSAVGRRHIDATRPLSRNGTYSVILILIMLIEPYNLSYLFVDPRQKTRTKSIYKHQSLKASYWSVLMKFSDINKCILHYIKVLLVCFLSSVYMSSMKDSNKDWHFCSACVVFSFKHRYIPGNTLEGMQRYWRKLSIVSHYSRRKKALKLEGKQSDEQI